MSLQEQVEDVVRAYAFCPKPLSFLEINSLFRDLLEKLDPASPVEVIKCLNHMSEHDTRS